MYILSGCQVKVMLPDSYTIAFPFVNYMKKRFSLVLLIILQVIGG